MSNRQFSFLRKEMVENQLIKRGITDKRVLSAFGEIPRELFVPDNLKLEAYQDKPLPIGWGQTISQPYIVALITELLGVGAGEKVLEVGVGSGYQSAILLSMGAQVHGVEKIPQLADRAKRAINSLGYNFNLKVGDGTLGWQKFSPYDKIVVSAASFKPPKSLCAQLKVGGKIIIPLGTRGHQKLTLGEKKSKDKINFSEACGCVFVPLVGREGWGE